MSKGTYVHTHRTNAPGLRPVRIVHSPRGGELGQIVGGRASGYFMYDARGQAIGDADSLYRAIECVHRTVWERP